MDANLAAKVEKVVKTPLEQAAGKLFGEGAKSAVSKFVTAENIQKVAKVAGPAVKEKLGRSGKKSS